MVDDGAKERLRKRGKEDCCALAPEDFAICGQAIWMGTAKLLIYLVDLIGIEPMTSSMPLTQR
jgi:hypothetical protein